jgi:hypothetical protein
VAPPSQVLDGDPSWFFLGQPPGVPGIARTAFGIPSACTSSPIAVCSGDGLLHYTWNIEQPRGTYQGYFQDVSAAYALCEEGIYDDYQLWCGVPTNDPSYNGLFIALPIFVRRAVYYLSGYYSPGPPAVVGMSLLPGVPDPLTDVFLIYDTGP